MISKSTEILSMVCLILILNNVHIKASIEEEEYGVKFASECEVCKLVTKEITENLEKKGSSDIIETGYSFDGVRKKTKYNKSELRLVEALEETCAGMMAYRIHKERHDSTRWAKQMSQTFKTLHGLVNKGVKVDLGIPHELWDNPSAEISQLRTQCENFLEDNEDLISKWYFGREKIGTDLQEFACPKLLRKDAKCLQEPYGEAIPSASENESGESGKKAKGDRKKLKKKTEL